MYGVCILELVFQVGKKKQASSDCQEYKPCSNIAPVVLFVTRQHLGGHACSFFVFRESVHRLTLHLNLLYTPHINHLKSILLLESHFHTYQILLSFFLLWFARTCVTSVSHLIRCYKFLSASLPTTSVTADDVVGRGE